MGTQFKLSETFTNKSGPKLYDAPYMDIGTIWRFDPTHVLGAFSGTPANGASIPNVARNRAASILSVGDASTLNGTFELVCESTSTISLERTAKGGLHIMCSQTTQTTNANRGVVRFPTALSQYIFNRVPTASAGFYVSVWSITTRAQVTNATPMSPCHFTSTSGSTANYLWHMQDMKTTSFAGGSLGYSEGVNTVNVPALDSLGCSAWVGTKPGTLASTYMALGGAGCIDAWAGNNINKARSLILYRVNVEDLLLCKRANSGQGGTLAEEYAAAYAADLTAFNEAFSVGGKFYGDTWTTPAI